MMVRRTAILLSAPLLMAAAPLAIAAPPEPPEPRIAAFTAPGAIMTGERVALAGRVAPAGTAPVQIERLGVRGWRVVRTVASDRRGVFRVELALTGSASFRARVRGSDAEPSRRRAIGVRLRASASVRAERFRQIAGQPVAVRGAVAGARAGAVVRIEGSRDGGRFEGLARTRLRDGRVASTVRLPRGGSWRLRLAVAPREGRDAGASATTAPLRVHDRNPHGVPASEPHYLVQVLDERQLYYYERGELQRVFPVVFGKPSTPTVVGSFRVYSKTVGPGPAFGPYALWYHGNYGIHGTNQEHLLDDPYRYYSLGCTRNYNDNIRYLYARVPIGTPVRSLHTFPGSR